MLPELDAARAGHAAPRPKPRFGHGVEVPLGTRSAGVGSAGAGGAGGPVFVASYHPSQQNTFTGVLTEAAFDALFARVRDLVAR